NGGAFRVSEHRVDGRSGFVTKIEPAKSAEFQHEGRVRWGCEILTRAHARFNHTKNTRPTVPGPIHEGHAPNHPARLAIPPSYRHFTKKEEKRMMVTRRAKLLSRRTTLLLLTMSSHHRCLAATDAYSVSDRLNRPTSTALPRMCVFM